MTEHSDSQLYYYKLNPIYQLYTFKSDKGLAICTISDHSILATIFIKDFSLVVDFFWDSITGKFLLFAFNDGSIRVYDIFKLGRLVSFFRSPLKQIKCVYWDRIIITETLDQQLKIFDYDLTNSMPTLVKFVKDPQGLQLVPVLKNTQAWRQIDVDLNLKLENSKTEVSTDDVLDIHLLYTESGMDNFAVLVNGVYDLSDIHVPNRSPNKVIKLVKASQGKYLGFYENASYRLIDVTPFSSNDIRVNLLNNSIDLRNSVSLLKEQIEIIKKELISPFESFINLVCVDAYEGYDNLYRSMTNLLLTGEISEEFEDWLINTIGERNLRKWKNLGIELLDKLVQILSLIFIPITEKFIITAERIQNYITAMRLSDNSKILENDSEINDLILNLSNILKTSIKQIPILNNDKMAFEIFIDWIRNTIYLIIDENYKSKLSLSSSNSYPFDIQKYINLQFKDHNKAILTVVDEFETYANKILIDLDMIDEKLIKPHLKTSIIISDIIDNTLQNSNKIFESSNLKVLDVLRIEEKSCFLFVVKELPLNHNSEIATHNYKIILSSEPRIGNNHSGKPLMIPEKYQNLLFKEMIIIEHLFQRNGNTTYLDSSTMLRSQLALNKFNDDEFNQNRNNTTKICLLLKFQKNDLSKEFDYVYGKVCIEVDQHFNIIQSPAPFQNQDVLMSLEVQFETTN
ncbi:hypothetical protein TPHA_0J00790 [Tetrapisispora phaffii CBS 4417]|uniref:Anaphase-promoting complex subunit 4 n=1 Tax=Tetrapisispora phaffii (strain ATCC 24235 / CBS 4417 / NBRC 1672 / NRRL Y-8282 / UCD 70-5) TaxID=1071381 RepID=G8BYG0_TETPH|nr:hypothetical protein TPHA_0J00790 [Tetrapisispora phaffii CBS 4417]CCE64902.1 hypothetical protein TPHA_0J00790 [Tetrapisispora phaffii CBS 4417]